MKTAVKKGGLVIPKRLLKGIKEAEIKWEKGKLIIEPIRIENDPILLLGSHPEAVVDLKMLL
jgi:hypothetical protein